MSIPKTKARNAYSGDNARILLHDAIDVAGRQWLRGETLTLLSSGYDNVRGCQYMHTTDRERFEGMV